MIWINRDISEKLVSLSQSFPALLVSGPRQCGKSSLLKHCFPAATYLTFDDPLLVLQAQGSPKDFLADLPEGSIILDEIQYVPELFRYIKIAIDEKRTKGRFLLNGSQNFQLGYLSAESLAGRLAILDLCPLSASEVQRAAKENKLPATDFDSMLLRGGYPELWSGGVNPADWYPAYITTYLQRDIRSLAKVEDLGNFSRFLRALALRTGSLLNYADLARDIGTAPNTIKNWISLLVTSGLISLIEGWASNLYKRLVKAPKVFFNDTGLLCSLLGIKNTQGLKDSPLYGGIWEAWCHAQLRIHLANLGRSSDSLYYWRTKEGKEIDFILEDELCIIAMECKAKELPNAADGTNLTQLQNTIPGRKIKKIILSKVANHVRNIPGTDISADNCLNLANTLSCK